MSDSEEELDIEDAKQLVRRPGFGRHRVLRKSRFNEEDLFPTMFWPQAIQPQDALYDLCPDANLQDTLIDLTWNTFTSALYFLGKNGSPALPPNVWEFSIVPYRPSTKGIDGFEKGEGYMDSFENGILDTEVQYTHVGTLGYYRGHRYPEDRAYVVVECRGNDEVHYVPFYKSSGTSYEFWSNYNKDQFYPCEGISPEEDTHKHFKTPIKAVKKNKKKLFRVKKKKINVITYELVEGFSYVEKGHPQAFRPSYTEVIDLTKVNSGLKGEARVWFLYSRYVCPMNLYASLFLEAHFEGIDWASEQSSAGGFCVVNDCECVNDYIMQDTCCPDARYVGAEEATACLDTYYSPLCCVLAKYANLLERVAVLAKAALPEDPRDASTHGDALEALQALVECSALFPVWRDAVRHGLNSAECSITQGASNNKLDALEEGGQRGLVGGVGVPAAIPTTDLVWAVRAQYRHLPPTQVDRDIIQPLLRAFVFSTAEARALAPEQWDRLPIPVGAKNFLLRMCG